MALLNTVANSAPMPATANATTTRSAPSPGLPNHSAADPTTSKVPNTAIHGLRRPEASAMAPSTGDSEAIRRPDAALA